MYQPDPPIVISPPATKDGDGFTSPLKGLATQLEIHARKCTRCNNCSVECDFLALHDSPKKIAEAYDPTIQEFHDLPFLCSLCGLCATRCPGGLNPAQLFLEMRREAVARNKVNLSPYRRLLNFEKFGTKVTSTFYGIPKNCTTILFPGCSLPGTRPEILKKLFHQLEKIIPDLGIVLDCCMKPSHDLGRNKQFSQHFTKLCNTLREKGVERVLIGCPSCQFIFKEYAPTLQIESVYNTLSDSTLDLPQIKNTKVTVHDPCTTRHSQETHTSIRKLLNSCALTISEMENRGLHTRCCGEGGGVGFTSKQLATSWTKKRAEEANGRRIITYCSGCTNYLGGETKINHILDILFSPESALAEDEQETKSPRTYLNRMLLKLYFKMKLKISRSA